MTKISQLDDVGSSLNAADAFIVQTPGDAITPNKKVTISGLTAYFNISASPFYTDIMVNTTPFIWNQSNDEYYEYRNTLNVAEYTGPTQREWLYNTARFARA
jgi:hypothetical protein